MPRSGGARSAPTRYQWKSGNPKDTKKRRVCGETGIHRSQSHGSAHPGLERKAVQEISLFLWALSLWDALFLVVSQQWIPLPTVTP